LGLCKLDIIVGAMKLDNQFEWDMDYDGASPERFAEVYASELGLAGKFKYVPEQYSLDKLFMTAV
jgi:SWI/SNF-related matrix-associated actin-dependent regulator of chromatin subfamily B protein 1